jgi:predicted RND superfamily exporter protein
LKKQDKENQMNRRRAGFLFLGICIVIAILLLTQAITPVAGAISFAISLVVLGWISGGFRTQ